jgi:hypothetical protein
MFFHLQSHEKNIESKRIINSESIREMRQIERCVSSSFFWKAIDSESISGSGDVERYAGKEASMEKDKPRKGERQTGKEKEYT